MIGYYISLAMRSLRGTPILSALMIAAIAVGVGASMTVLTVNYMTSKNPLEHKDNVLYSVQLDSWDPNEAYNRGGRGNQMPWQLTYQDAVALLRSDIPARQVAMHRFGFTVTTEDTQVRPFVANARVTTRDFFGLFDVPFQYGGTWEKSADETPTLSVVLSSATNTKIFGEKNSVGEIIQLNGEPFTVIGVLEEWNPSPKVHDLNNGAFNDSEEIYIPFGLHRKFEIHSWGNNNGWNSGGNDGVTGYEAHLQSESVWIQYWVELESAAQKRDYEEFISNYIRQQKEQGRFQRPLKFALSQPSEWLVLNEVLDQDSRVLAWCALAFLLVCVVNAVALLLAKFLRKAPEAGVRRALGAGRGSIFTQHLIESSCIGLLGGLAGIVLTLVGLAGVRLLTDDGFDRVAQMDWAMVFSAIALAVFASLLAGLYPAWRISRTNPSVYLKTQ
ncbi:ABC transporter ATP-binding protein [Microbulbifer agarilyticus]|uniref:ABC transporter ATP-binding protein n=1 Tax=Microbulbifer agarilyticus TaxID=260552 RepID=A0A1Q2M8G1_9GAMM|nr:ABC transporter permease [Microbulbifer agarilyticus]AQQ68577.1 ABC transporter ATP-binding protein [Microbulbifer agarilyticus]